MEQKLNVKDLSADEKQALLLELQAEEKAKQDLQKQEVADYHTLKFGTVDSVYQRLQKVSSELVDIKTQMLGEFDSLNDMKKELFDVKETQQSHTWTNANNTISIITGYNTIDGWDETVSVGIEKVNEWLAGKTSDGNKDLVKMIRSLLKPNTDGVLKASRVLDLQNQARELNDQELITAVDLIRDAHRPSRTGTYIKAKSRDENGKWQWLPLSMSAV